MTTYAVKDWDRLFENAQSRRYGLLRWFPVPNRYDTTGYAKLMDRDDGTQLYGAWILTLGVASRMPVRGLLFGTSGAIGAAELAARTRGPASIFEMLIQVVSDPEENICWLEKVAGRTAAALVRDRIKRGSSSVPTRSTLRARSEHARSSPRLNRIEPNRTELNRKEKKPVTGKARKLPAEKIGPDGTRLDKELRAAQRKAEGRHRDGHRSAGTLIQRLSNETTGQSNGEWVVGFGKAIGEALGLETWGQRTQFRAFAAVGKRFVDLPDRERRLVHCVRLARAKAKAKRLRNPSAAWQASVDEVYPRRE